MVGQVRFPPLNEILRHRGVRWISLGSLAFIAENLILSHNREWIITNFTDARYHQLYNTLSTLACGSIAYGYIFHGRRQGPQIQGWVPVGAGRTAAAFGLQAMGWIGLFHLLPRLQVPVTFGSLPVVTASQSVAQSVEPLNHNKKPPPRPLVTAPGNTGAVYARCPIDFTPEGDAAKSGPYGLKRVSRHPTFWSLAFWGLGSALMTPYLTEMIMFSMPFFFACIGTTHQDYRYRRGSGGRLTPEMEAQTSNIPFGALLSGKQRWEDVAKEMKHTNAALAMCLSAALVAARKRAPI